MYRFLIFVFLVASLLIMLGGGVAAASVSADLPAPDFADQLMRKSGQVTDSPWYQTEKAGFHRVLARQKASVLLVPFQSEFYAVDRIERSLMTRYLADTILSRSDMTIPDITLVERTLGETLRRYQDNDIFTIADEIGAEFIIKGYVGHRIDQKMVITLQVLRRQGGEHFTAATPVAQSEWKDIAFSDRHLPSEAFLSMLDDVEKSLPFALRRPDRPKPFPVKDKISLPPSPLDLVKNTANLAPIDAAYRLQFLGALYPESMDLGRERLFVRSLVALNHVNPRTPDYGIIKSRALYYLNRRPAALEALEGLHGPEADGLRAVLNGDLYELEKAVVRIRSPLQFYLAQIELFDLRWIYEVLPYLKVDQESVGKDDPKWQGLLQRRLWDRDVWGQFMNLAIKNLLDEVFPVQDRSAQDVYAGALVQDVMSGREEIALSVYNHVYQSLEKDEGRWSGLQEGYVLKPLDLLLFLESVGDANVLREIYFLLFVQGAPDRAISLIDRYGPIYGGNPLFDYYHAHASYLIANRRTGVVRDGLLRQAIASARRAYFWSGAQTSVSHNATELLMRSEMVSPLYNGDFPRRPFWFVKLPEADRPLDKQGISSNSVIANSIIALDYETSDFARLSSLYTTLKMMNDASSAKAIIEANRQRFRGHPDRIKFLATLKIDEDDEEQAQEMYAQAMKDEPYNWSNYYELGLLHIGDGAYARAAETFLAYPPFSDAAQIYKVGLSESAFLAGMQLAKRGAISEARPLLDLSAGYNTGSAAGLKAGALLALSQGKYAEAIAIFRNLIVRYNDFDGYNGYISLLFAFGYKDLAMSVLRSSKGRVPALALSDAILAGMRLAEGNDIEYLNTLLKDERNPNRESVLASRIALSLIDAQPSERGLAELKTYYPSPMLRRDAVGGVEQKGPENIWFHTGPDELAPAASGNSPTLDAVKSDYEYFVEGYQALLDKDWKAADQIFDQRGQYYSNLVPPFRYALPYVVRAKLKNGGLARVEAYLAAHSSEQEDVNGYVAQALVEGERGRHENAVSLLRKGMAARKSARVLFGTWYVLMETAEWLYEDSGQEAYRSLLLEWARAYQQISPTSAWSYAIEAVHSEPSSRRQRALALALYLDPASRRLHSISDEEKSRARQWLDQNNPFLLSRPDKSSVGI